MEAKPQSIVFKIRLNTYLFPISFMEMTNALEKIGYEINPALPFPRPIGRLSGAGEIARKGKSVVSINADAQTLLVQDVSINSAIKCFDEVLTSLQEECGVDLNTMPRFYGFSATYIIPTKKKAYTTFAKSLRIPIQNDVEKIFNEKLWPYEIRFAGSNMKANSENWFDISVKPNYERDDSYVVTVVYRNILDDKTREFMNSFEERIKRMLQLING
jgi:hypothetical protein